ncbi:hypothetical protein ACFL2T_06610 [Elusimicrobiota bacterium]
MRTIALLFAFCALLPGMAAAEEAGVSESSGTTVEDLYGGLKYRDPFTALTGGGGSLAGGGGAVAAPTEEFDLEEDFNIHKLQLKGIMEDRKGTFALFVDPEFRMGFILRKGPKGKFRLEDYRRNPVPGVRGSINVTQKSVVLTMPDGDSQPFNIGEDDEDDEDDEDEEPEEDDPEDEE